MSTSRWSSCVTCGGESEVRRRGSLFPPVSCVRWPHACAWTGHACLYEHGPARRHGVDTWAREPALCSQDGGPAPAPLPPSEWRPGDTAPRQWEAGRLAWALPPWLAPGETRRAQGGQPHLQGPVPRPGGLIFDSPDRAGAGGLRGSGGLPWAWGHALSPPGAAPYPVLCRTVWRPRLRSIPRPPPPPPRRRALPTRPHSPHPDSMLGRQRWAGGTGSGGERGEARGRPAHTQTPSLSLA